MISTPPAAATVPSAGCAAQSRFPHLWTGCRSCKAPTSLRFTNGTPAPRKHWFCSVCGIYTHHQRRSNPNEYGVNVACLEGVNPRDLGNVPWTDGINHPSDRT